MVAILEVADVISAEHPLAGVVKPNGEPAGRLLRDLLAEVGESDSVVIPVPDADRAKLARLARLTGNASHKEMAENRERVISIKHLKRLDPDTTRVMVGYRIDWTYDEALKLGLRDPDRPL